ncbi:MAG: hypothetical protein IT184_05650 [Acidobacteria bacterium]|nr:hypothetical protein [Acidobacteriota bacterium]
MNRTERKRYEMMIRVGEFGSSNREQFPESSPAGQAFAAVHDAVARIDAHAKAKLLTREEGRQARASLRKAIEARVKIVARVARIVGRSVPGADSKFKLPSRKSGVALLTAARAFVDEGATAVERFVPFGMPATMIAELRELIARYDRADRDRRVGQDGFARAREGTKAAFAIATEALRVLGVVVPTTLAADAVLLGAWHEARRVEAPAKAARSKPSEPPVVSGPEAPSGAPVVDGGGQPAEPEPALRKVS